MKTNLLSDADKPRGVHRSAIKQSMNPIASNSNKQTYWATSLHHLFALMRKSLLRNFAFSFIFPLISPSAAFCVLPILTSFLSLNFCSSQIPCLGDLWMNLLCLSNLLVGMGCSAGCRDSTLAVCLCLDSGQDETFLQFQRFSKALINVFSKSFG